MKFTNLNNLTTSFEEFNALDLTKLKNNHFKKDSESIEEWNESSIPTDEKEYGLIFQNYRNEEDISHSLNTSQGKLRKYLYCNFIENHDKNVLKNLGKLYMEL